MAATTTKLDLGLDDIIKQNKKSKGPGGRGGNRGGNRGGSGFRGRSGNRGGRGGAKPGMKRLNSQSPLKSRNLGSGKWQHDKANGASSVPAGPARLAISNLDFGVNDQDINELFSRCGHIVKACVHYDANGRSQGTAEVVYRNQKEGLAAVNEYNGRLLDGRAMNVAIVGGAPKPASLASRIGSAPNRGGFNRNKRGGRASTGGAANGGGARGRGGARGGRGGGRGRGGRSGPALSKEDLDKQMEEYRMQTDTA